MKTDVEHINTYNKLSSSIASKLDCIVSKIIFAKLFYSHPFISYCFKQILFNALYSHNLFKGPFSSGWKKW